MIDGNTLLIGLIGHPVGHSFSPAMHNAAAAALGLNVAYVPLPVLPEHLPDSLRGLIALGFRGVNVTVPHKEAALAHLDAIFPAAQAIGAVNTIVVGAPDEQQLAVANDHRLAAGHWADVKMVGAVAGQQFVGRAAVD